VAAGSGVTVSVTGRLPEDVAHRHTVRATADDGRGGAIARSADVLVGGPDLAASTLVGLPDHVAVGQTLAVAVNVVNTGPVSATAEVRASVPSGLAPAAGGVDPDTGEPVWRGDVAPGESVTATLALTVTPSAAAGPRTLEITLDDGWAPPMPRRWSVGLVVRRPDLAGSQTILSPPDALSGAPVTATVLLGNLGQVAAEVEVQDFLPPLLVVEAPSVRSSTGTTSAGIGVVRWSVEVPAARRELDWTPDRGRVDLTGFGPIGPQDPQTGFRGPVPLGVAFPFHTAVYTQAWVADRGLLTFVPPDPDAAAVDDLPVATLAPLWRPGGAPAPAPRVRRAADRAAFAWPASTETGAFAVELGAGGEIRFVYGPGVGTFGAVVGLRTPEGQRLSIPAADVPVGGAARVGTPGSWAWLRFRTRLGAVAPNAVVTHSVRVRALTGERDLVAGLRANRLRLDGSTLEAEPRTRTAGATVRYTLTIAAEGQVDARRVDVGIDLPDGLEPLPGPAGGLAVGGPGQELAWHGSVAAGQRRVFTWSARLREDVVAGARLQTRATVRAAGVAPVVLAATTKVARADFSGSEKRVSRPVAVPGQRLAFTLHVVNAGAESTWVELIDAMPPELEFDGGVTVSHGAPPAWDERSRTLRWTGDLPPQSSTRIGFLARYVGPGPAVNVMRLSDGQGSHFAAWAEVQPVAAAAHLPLVSHGP
jgi:hypothetical protein